ncbi:MAG: FAD-binding oxidoreductase [Woeseiaceae bacterium]
MISTQPHTGSYYAATANQSTDYAPLEGEQRADVCVVGAGFTGISTALHLAERGYNVHVVEASKVGWGASGRNGGQMIGGISGEERLLGAGGPGVEKLLWEMRWAGHDIIRDRVARYGIDCDLKAGYLDVALKKRHLKAFRAEFDNLQRHEFPHEFKLLSASETRDVIGTEAYIGSLLNMGNGHLHPLNLCVGEARAAVKNGATIYESSPALRIEMQGKPKVISQNGSVLADWVVIAGNAYHSLVSELRGILFPVNSFITATEPLSDALVQAINPRDLAVCDPNFVLEYFRLSADKRLLFGGRINYFGADPAFIKQNHRPRMLKIYPQLQDTKIDYAWGGTIGVPFNRVPQFGRVAPNVIYAQGYSGHGVNVTHLAGKILADVIAGTCERFDVFAKIKPVRLPGAHRLQKPMVALGVFYYQLRDWL